MLALTHALFGLTFSGSLVQVLPVWAGDMHSIEVFTADERPVVGADNKRLGSATVTIYAVNGLARFQSALSEGLPADSEAAKKAALQRIQQLDATQVAQAKNAAIGLANAIQYGVDRYPAIVFDERAVVYGVTDLVKALNRYEAWQREQTR